MIKAEKLVKDIFKLTKTPSNNLADTVSKFNKKYPFIRIVRDENKLFVKAGRHSTELIDIIRLISNKHFLEAYEKLISPSIRQRFKRDLLANTRIINRLENLPEMKAFKSLPSQHVFPGLVEPISELAFRRLVLTNSKFSEAIKHIGRKLKTKTLRSKFLGLAITAAAGTTLYHIIKNHADKSSGCYKITVLHGQVHKCKLQSRSCGDCNNGYEETMCIENAHETKWCAEKFHDSKNCCEDCIIRENQIVGGDGEENNIVPKNDPIQNNQAEDNLQNNGQGALEEDEKNVENNNDQGLVLKVEDEMVLKENGGQDEDEKNDNIPPPPPSPPPPSPKIKVDQNEKDHENNPQPPPPPPSPQPPPLPPPLPPPPEIKVVKELRNNDDEEMDVDDENKQPDILINENKNQGLDDDNQEAGEPPENDKIENNLPPPPPPKDDEGNQDDKLNLVIHDNNHNLNNNNNDQVHKNADVVDGSHPMKEVDENIISLKFNNLRSENIDLVERENMLGKDIDVNDDDREDMEDIASIIDEMKNINHDDDEGDDNEEDENIPKVSYECIKMSFLDATTDLLDSSFRSVTGVLEKAIYYGKYIFIGLIIFLIIYLIYTTILKK